VSWCWLPTPGFILDVLDGSILGECLFKFLLISIILVIAYVDLQIINFREDVIRRLQSFLKKWVPAISVVYDHVSSKKKRKTPRWLILARNKILHASCIVGSYRYSV
jgi:hypothetical protein